jgi:hypothetical protein
MTQKDTLSSRSLRINYKGSNSRRCNFGAILITCINLNIPWDLFIVLINIWDNYISVLGFLLLLGFQNQCSGLFKALSLCLAEF